MTPQTALPSGRTDSPYDSNCQVTDASAGHVFLVHGDLTQLSTCCESRTSPMPTNAAASHRLCHRRFGRVVNLHLDGRINPQAVSISPCSAWVRRGNSFRLSFRISMNELNSRQWVLPLANSGCRHGAARCECPAGLVHPHARGSTWTFSRWGARRGGVAVTICFSCFSDVGMYHYSSFQ